MPKPKKNLYYLSALLIIVIFVALSARSYQALKTYQALATLPKPAPQVVRTVTLASGTLDHILDSYATLQSIASVDIKSESAGIITHLYIKEGDYVNKGDLLATIDDRIVSSKVEALAARKESIFNQMQAAQHNVNSLKALREAAKTRLDFAKKELTRSEQLFKAKAIASSMLEKNQTQYSDAHSSLQDIASKISSNEMQIASLRSEQDSLNQETKALGVLKEQTSITSPVNGIISLLFQEKGNFIAIGNNLCRIESDNSTRLIMKIPEKMAHLIKTTQRVVPTSDSLRQFEYQINRIHPTTSHSGQLTVEAIPTNESLPPPYGRKIEVGIMIKQYKGTLVPTSAQFVNFNDESQIYVYLIKNNQAQRHTVKPIAFNNSNDALVDSAELPEGSILVAGNYLDNIKLLKSFKVEYIQ